MIRFNPSALLFLALIPVAVHGLVPVPTTIATSRRLGSRNPATRLRLVPELMELTSTLVSYTNDPVGDIIAEIKPAYLAATFAAIAAVGVTFVQVSEKRQRQQDDFS